MIPLALGNIFQQLYNITDTYILGKYVSSNALAAVGSLNSLLYIFNSVIFGLRSGVSVVASTYFGERRMDKVKTTIQTGFSMLFVVGILSTLIGVLGGRLIIRFMKTPEVIAEDAILYLKIYSGGLIFLFVFNLCTAIFQSLGDSIIPFLILCVSTVLNIVLDILFVCIFRMEVRGAAYATVIAELILAVLAVSILLIKLKTLKVNQKTVWFDYNEFSGICRVGLPSVLQQGILAIGVFTVQFLINQCGPDVIAGNSIASRIEGIATMPIVTIGEAMSVFTAQNIGAGKRERISRGIRLAIRFDMGLVFCMFLIIATSGRWLIGLFMVGSNEAITQAGMEYLYAMTTGALFMGVAHNLNGAMRGARQMKGFLLSYLTNIISRVILSMMLFSIWGRIGIWISLPLSIFFGMLVAIKYYFKDVYYVKTGKVVPATVWK